MPSRIQSPVALYHNYKEKRAAKKGRHKQHDVGVSDTSQGMMESPSGSERPEQTPVGHRQTEKREIKHPILQLTTQDDGQDQELLDELMARPRPARAPLPTKKPLNITVRWISLPARLQHTKKEVSRFLLTN